jgi:hypothetical protein
MSGPHQHPRPAFPDGRTLFSDPSQHGQAVVTVQNCTPYKTLIQNKDPVGVLENIENCDTHDINPEFINILVQCWVPQTRPLTTDERKFIMETICFTVPKSY